MEYKYYTILTKGNYWKTFELQQYKIISNILYKVTITAFKERSCEILSKEFEVEYGSSYLQTFPQDIFRFSKQSV